jgi:hypothetical protein
MDKYIGVKIVEAELMTCFEFHTERTGETTKDLSGDQMGYKVKDSYGNVSWYQIDIFEKTHMQIIPNPSLKTDISISQQMVDKFIKEVHPSTIGEKTTLVRVVLVNDFELVEASACVDKANYSEEIGAEICLGKIKDKIWAYLGFLLQTGVGGVK